MCSDLSVPILRIFMVDSKDALLHVIARKDLDCILVGFNTGFQISFGTIKEKQAVNTVLNKTEIPTALQGFAYSQIGICPLFGCVLYRDLLVCSYVVREEMGTQTSEDNFDIFFGSLLTVSANNGQL